MSGHNVLLIRSARSRWIMLPALEKVQKAAKFWDRQWTRKLSAPQLRMEISTELNVYSSSQVIAPTRLIETEEQTA